MSQIKFPIELTVATTNVNKIRDLKLFVDHNCNRNTTRIILRTLPEDLPPLPEENGISLVENAYLKAKHYSQYVEGPIIADDSGIFVDALGGAPGIFTRRWSDETNERLCDKLLRHLEGVEDDNREATISTGMVYYNPQLTVTTAEDDAKRFYSCEHHLKGRIVKENHFPDAPGYRGVWAPINYGWDFWAIYHGNKTLAELGDDIHTRPGVMPRSVCLGWIIDEIYDLED